MKSCSVKKKGKKRKGRKKQVSGIINVAFLSLSDFYLPRGLMDLTPGPFFALFVAVLLSQSSLNHLLNFSSPEEAVGISNDL